MDTALTEGYQDIIETVRTWPATSRLALVQDVLASLTADDLSPRQPTVNLALGLLSTDDPASTDGEVAALLVDRRRERFDP